MPGQLDGKVALVTGAGTGIGKAIAAAFVREGARVVLTGRRREPLEAHAAELGGGAKARAVAGDVSKPADAERMVAETIAAYGALHLVVNNAGIARFGKLDESSVEDIGQMVDVDLKGPMFVCRAALPRLKMHRDAGGAAILNISSSVTSLAVQNFAVYAAAKAGLDHLTRCMALDYGPERIRVNAILPGVVDTPIFETAMPKAAVPKAMEAMAKLHPLGRVGRSEEIAGMAVYLCGPQAQWITGALVNVDGGIGLGAFQAK